MSTEPTSGSVLAATDSQHARNATGAEIAAQCNVFTHTLRGVVPPPGGSGSTKFLREDGTWQTVGSNFDPTIDNDFTAIQTIPGVKGPQVDYPSSDPVPISFIGSSNISAEASSTGGGAFFQGGHTDGLYGRAGFAHLRGGYGGIGGQAIVSGGVGTFTGGNVNVDGGPGAGNPDQVGQILIGTEHASIITIGGSETMGFTLKGSEDLQGLPPLPSYITGTGSTTTNGGSVYISGGQGNINGGSTVINGGRSNVYNGSVYVGTDPFTTSAVRIGNSYSKLSFHGATPVPQQTGITDLPTLLAAVHNLGLCTS